ncbi:MAG: LacI family DNA-binding transcriptional regulator, partial [Clostridia bacterium]|nr:LacI family DNA-binding transcriptional regulator [Clostridia bacterium]
MNKQTKLTDIAKKLNISISTVSRALNDASDVSEETKLRVRRTAHELHYLPNETARSLVMQKNNIIAVIVPNISNPYHCELVKGIEGVLHKENYSIVLCIYQDNDVIKEEYIREMLRKRVVGMVFIGTRPENDSLFEKMITSTIVVGIQSTDERIDRVNVDENKNVYKIISKLAELGHKRIAFLGSMNGDVEFLEQRLESYKKALADSGLPIDESIIIDDQNKEEPGYHSAKELLKDKSITAIHCMYDELAMGAYMAICDEGLKVPDDISLSGFDGLRLSKLIRPALTTVRVPIKEMGESAAELILQRLQYGQKEEKQ